MSGRPHSSDGALVSLPMSTRYPSPQPVDITAGTAIKLGFFAALGAALFSLILTVVAGIIGVVIALILGTSLFAMFGN